MSVRRFPQPWTWRLLAVRSCPRSIRAGSARRPSERTDRTHRSEAAQLRVRTGWSAADSAAAAGRPFPAVRAADRLHAARAAFLSHLADRRSVGPASPASLPDRPDPDPVRARTYETLHRRPSTRLIPPECARSRRVLQAAGLPAVEVDRPVPAAAVADRSAADHRWAGRSPADLGRADGRDPGAAAADRREPVPAEVQADPAWGPPEEPAAAVPAAGVPEVQAVAAGAGVPGRDVPDRSEHPVPVASEGEHRPAGPGHGPRRARDEWPAAGDCPGELPRAARDARAAPPARRPGCPVHRWGRACYQAGWECSLTTPSLHRLRCPEHPVRSRRRCARSRAVCRLHRDSSTARPWSVGRPSEPAWQRSGSRHHWR